MVMVPKRKDKVVNTVIGKGTEKMEILSLMAAYISMGMLRAIYA